MSSSNLPPDARLDARPVLDSLRDYLDQLREEGIEGLPGTLNPVRAEGKPLPLSAARPSRPVEMPEGRLTLRRESVEQRMAAGAGVMPVRGDTAQRMGGQTESGEDIASPAEAAMVAGRPRGRRSQSLAVALSLSGIGKDHRSRRIARIYRRVHALQARADAHQPGFWRR